MNRYTLAHLSDSVLLHDLAALVGQDRLTTAKMLAHIAEVDARRLYAQAGYSSMHAYCVDELHLSEDSAYKRIRGARAAREFPVIFEAVAEGRLHLAGVCLLAPHLTPVNVDELVVAATHRRKFEIEVWLAQRFPSVGVREVARAVTPIRAQRAPEPNEGSRSNGQLALGRVESEGDELALGRAAEEAKEAELAPGRVDGVASVPSLERYLVRATISKSTHDKLCRAQALLSHAVPTGDVAQVLDRALDTLITHLEKRKVGAVSRRPAGPRAPCREKGSHGTHATHGTASVRSRPIPKIRSRHVPAPVRRAVWERDQGRCTFVSASGIRCDARRFLEFDHIEPVARGGRATVEGIRLRCRAHNQYEAEKVFGAGFMDRRREEARLAAKVRRKGDD